jgi:pimeloyl-ACP methyl ester carboxylesterase
MPDANAQDGNIRQYAHKFAGLHVELCGGLAQIFGKNDPVGWCFRCLPGWHWTCSATLRTPHWGNAMQFVLVHGSFHGAWCWEHLIPLLEQRGHQAVAPNLPGSGDDPAPLENANLDSYATRIAGVIDGMPGRIVLVGHSMGGIVSSQVAERRPQRLAAVVYISGLLFRSDEGLVSFLNDHAHLGVEDLVLKNMKVSDDGVTATFPQEAAAEVFYNTSPPALAAWAASRLRPQRMQVYHDPLALTPQCYGSVPRFYVEGLQDNAVSIAYQRAMTGRTPCERVFTLDCDHSPFLSMPTALADILDEVARAKG